LKRWRCAGKGEEAMAVVIGIDVPQSVFDTECSHLMENTGFRELATGTCHF
jgi:hypothetical protein